MFRLQLLLFPLAVVALTAKPTDGGHCVGGHQPGFAVAAGDEGITQENRNLKVGPQPARLFEIPADFVMANAPRMPAGAGTGRSAGSPVASGAGQAAPASRGGAPGAAWKLNTNYPGGDYRDFVPTRASAVLCAEACANESRCRAWTWVNNELEPPTGHCWLKSSVPEPGQDDCCVSGVKR